MRIFQLLLIITLVAGIAAAICWPRAGEQVMGNYCTSLQGRTRGQRMNATRAAKALDGVVIEAGHEFSFNKTVGSWSPDRGYVLAPVSYDGELVVDWGGGVCQTSTTLYNAALIAGLQVVERHRHSWAPHYVPPGRDAAVAQRTVDLRLRNPYPTPVRLRVIADDSRIGFEIIGRQSGPVAEVQSAVLSSLPPGDIIKIDNRLPAGQRRIINHGQPGVRVSVYRTFTQGARVGTRELVSQDGYPAMNRVVAVGQGGGSGRHTLP
ncbi:MAG: VanW family protein [Armatimonadota bacterium]